MLREIDTIFFIYDREMQHFFVREAIATYELDETAALIFVISDSRRTTSKFDPSAALLPIATTIDKIKTVYKLIMLASSHRPKRVFIPIHSIIF